MRFLFWNINAAAIDACLASLAGIYHFDVIVLAECTTTPGELLLNLNAEASLYQYSHGFCEKLKFFTRFRASFLKPVFESDRLSIRKLALPGRKEIILAGVHLPSGLYFSDQSLTLECANLAQIVSEQERAAGHSRTILVGDLNVNPFHPGVVAAGALHAVSSKEVARRGRRTVQGRTYEFFYNPMWPKMGSLSGEPPGTYYYERAESLCYFWNAFDQVLVRPALLPGLSDKSVRVLTEAGDISLLNESRIPDRQRGSDHLPVMLDIDF